MRYVSTRGSAPELGFADVGTMWRSGYDMSPEEFAKLTDRIWNEVRPLYEALHTYVRRQLNKKYGSAVQPATGPIRADLLGNMWAQEWGNIYDVVAPKGAGDLGLPVHHRLPGDPVAVGEFGAQHRLVQAAQHPLMPLQEPGIQRQPAPVDGLHLGGNHGVGGSAGHQRGRWSDGTSPWSTPQCRDAAGVPDAGSGSWPRTAPDARGRR